MSFSDPQYLFDPDEKPVLPLVSVPLLVASDATLDRYGYLVEEPDQCEIEIVRWPAQGWRSIDEGTGDEGGTADGTFHCHWSDGVLMGRNDAVNGDYVLGWSADRRISPNEPAAYRDHIAIR